MPPNRHAAIDVGTNTVLLLVAEERDGRLEPVVERAEITRLGRGVDATRRLAPDAIRDTVEVLGRFAAEARALGASRIACVATSAARDAVNGTEFFAAARAAAGLVPEVISGEEEARLVYGSAWRDFGVAPGGPDPLPAAAPLAVLDVGGGSTELVFGDGPAPRGRTSLQVGAVRLTERHVRSDPLPLSEQSVLREAAREALAPLTRLDGIGDATGARLVGVAGTVTTLCSVSQELPVYDATRVHGAAMTLDEIDALVVRLAGLTVAERQRLPGMEPKRADVIVAGGIVVAEAMRLTGFERLTVSDRGVRWGLLYDRLRGER
ncbi:MAG TPA: Ppx/GppA phosphatase family protein [Anaeromyxobacteraceae bacterium]|nr:Ppx/GppA phosphatase family protein [Anaeromyxobacteraceae bacterium]